MQIDHRRRAFLKYLLLNSAITTTFCAGLLKPTQVLANWPKSAFKSTSVTDALNALYGSDKTTSQQRLITLRARPHLGDGGTQVTVRVSTMIPGVDSITILAPNNQQPLAATFKFKNKDAASLHTRITMEDKGEIIAILKSGDRLYSETTEVDFAGCGCG